jgi:hypothetical protein
MLNRARIWHQPERGLLIGQVTALGEDSQFSLEDFDGYIWQVFYGQAKIPPAMIIQPGLKLQIVGNKIDDNQFEAQLLRPLNPPFHQPFMRSLLDKQPSFPDMPEGMRGNIPPPPNIPDMK